MRDCPFDLGLVDVSGMVVSRLRNSTFIKDLSTRILTENLKKKGLCVMNHIQNFIL